MNKKEIIAFSIPLLAVLCIYLTVYFVAKPLYKNSSVEDLLPTGIIPASCPSFFKQHECMTTSLPVMGGLDLVEYFTAYRTLDGSYNESESGKVGLPGIKSDYSGYTFYFNTFTNKLAFDLYPGTYLPQYGGFCAWAVAGEVVGYPWSPLCLGPSGNRNIWSVIDGKLFFFKDTSAKHNFLTDTTKYVAAGNLRWSSWFGANTNKRFDTNCTLFNS